LLERVGVPADRVTVNYNGLSPTPEEADLPRHASACTVTRLSPEKGIVTLIDAWVEVARSAPESSLSIVGDGVLYESLQQRAADLGLTSSVRFLGFQRPPLASVRDCSIFVLPSLSEGFGIAILEAMRAGKAVIASRVGGIPELVDDGRSGILVPPGEPHALSEAILELLRNQARREELARAGQRRAREFTLERSARGISDIYEELVRAKLGLSHSAEDGLWLRRPAT